MGDDDSVSSSGYKGPLRKPYSAPPTAINCSHKAPAKRVDVNPFTGQSKTPKTSKKPKGGRRKLGKGQQLFSLWNRWRELVQARFDVELKNPQPSGQDVGHLKNILTVCGDYDTVFDVMELICTDWGLIKQNWDWLAKGSPVPTLRMIDVIKTELYAITQGTTPLKTKQGAGKWYPRKAEKEDGGGYEMVMME